MTPDQLRRMRMRRMNLLMAYASFASTKAASEWTPSELFAASEVGVWYDPSDFSTMFQDSAGTTPVTAVEQNVGLIQDKSGNGNHASQSNSSSRPVLRQEAGGQYYLAFDGSDDSLATAAIDFSATDEMTVFAGVRKLQSAAVGVIAELSANIGLNNGAFSVLDRNTTAYGVASKGTSGGDVVLSTSTSTPPVTSVVSGLFEISADQSTIRLDGVEENSSITDQGTGNYGNYALYIGRRGGASSPFNGRLYSLIVRGKSSTADEITAAEAWVNGKTGAY